MTNVEIKRSIHMKRNKGYLSRSFCSERISLHHLCLADSTAAGDYRSFMVEKMGRLYVCPVCRLWDSCQKRLIGSQALYVFGGGSIFGFLLLAVGGKIGEAGSY